VFPSLLALGALITWAFDKKNLANGHYRWQAVAVALCAIRATLCALFAIVLFTGGLRSWRIPGELDVDEQEPVWVAALAYVGGVCLLLLTGEKRSSYFRDIVVFESSRRKRPLEIQYKRPFLDMKVSYVLLKSY